ncbi:MAG: NrfD/PsrC family molybdoenzyme membrane anchor subunit [Mycobacterium leprae]
MVERAEFTSYYGRPIVKKPVWKWPVPAYFFTGGLAGGSSLLGFGGAVTGNWRLARHGRRAGFVAILASTAFLIEDLGRPERFLNMMRVFKPSSPMSMGSWTLMLYGPTAGLAVVTDILHGAAHFPARGGAKRRPWVHALARSRLLDRVSFLGEIAAGLSGIGVASYTAVLVTDTSVPVWYAARRELPFVFVGSSMAASGGLAAVVNPAADCAPARRMAVLGSALELVASDVSRRRMRAGPVDVGEVYEQGRAGRLERLSQALTVAGAVLTGVVGRRRGPAAVGGALLVGGSLAKRFAVYEAGMQSADDPTYTVGPQQARAAGLSEPPGRARGGRPARR